MKHIRTNEYLVFLYRIFLAYAFYMIARVLFFLFNRDIIPIENTSEFLSFLYYGIAFDTTAILYVNLLFILLSILPLWINTNKNYQKIVFYIYFINRDDFSFYIHIT